MSATPDINTGIQLGIETDLTSNLAIDAISAPTVDSAAANLTSTALEGALKATDAAAVQSQIATIAEPKNLGEFMEQQYAAEDAAKDADKNSSIPEPTADVVASAQKIVETSNPLAEAAAPPDDVTDDAEHSDGAIKEGDAPAIAQAVDKALNENSTSPTGEAPPTQPADPERSTAKLQDPGEFNEAAQRQHIERDNQTLTPEQIESKVTESRQSHAERTRAYQEQQLNRPPEERRDELIQMAKQGTLTTEGAQHLNDAKIEIKNNEDLAKLEDKMLSDEPLEPEEMKRYQELKNSDKTGEMPTEAEVKTLEQQSQGIIEQIRNGEGDLLNNILELEGVQRKMQGETLSRSMRKILADALQNSIEGGDLNNEEAETVMEKISQLYGLEMQMAQLPEQYGTLEKQADGLDKKITTAQGKIQFDKSSQSAQRRKEMYNDYVQLTMVEAQMASLATIDQQLKQKFNAVMNQVDFTLGRQNIISYAMRGLGNARDKHMLQRTAPNLRSTRHRNLLGF